MLRLLLFFTLLPLAIAIAARWWFGVRALTGDGPRPCRCDLARWLPAPGDTASVHRADAPAGEFGRQLRLKALAEWHEQDPKAAAAREASRRFGAAVPPLSALVAIFAVLVGKVMLINAIALVFAAVALATVFGLLALPAELTAITRTIRRVREDKCFPSRDDEEAVTRCAIAHAWASALPPILRWIHG